MRAGTPEDEEKAARRDWLMGLIRELRSFTLQLHTTEPRTSEYQKLQQQWDDKLFEIVSQPFKWLAEQRRRRPMADFDQISRELVDALDRLAEYKMARDHIGNRRYDDARRNAVSRFVGFASAVVMGLRNR